MGFASLHPSYEPEEARVSSRCEPEVLAAESAENKKKRLYHTGGKTYFDRKTEKGFFLVLTILAVCFFLLQRWGLFG
jgi:hypothetical protein